ncbi:hypothetical protein OIU78_013219 [Salix suchowensis]|nr:hypothetical protein OIU78_013219 [Salix suchowensis]
MQRSCEASLKCLQIKGSPYGNTLEGFPGFKEEIGAHPDSQKMQQCQMNCFESQFYPFPLQTRFHVTGQLEACFQTYVRPTCNQLLSEFCKDLTGIQQIQVRQADCPFKRPDSAGLENLYYPGSDYQHLLHEERETNVDRGVTLSEALLRHDKWLENKGIKNTSFAVVTWSNWDCRVMLESECRFKKIRKPPYFNRWINLKVPFCEIFGGARCLKEAVEMAGLEWQGRAHCGLDDAKNTARLLALLMHRGIRFSITNSLMWHATDSSLPCKQSPENLSFSPPCKLKEMRLPVFPYPPFCFLWGEKQQRNGSKAWTKAR